MQLSLGFSPCPNDTFIFDALVNSMPDAGPLNFAPVLEDVQTLNRWALEGKLAITKLSYGVMPLVTSHYQVLDSGSALGTGVGPLLITRERGFNGEVKDQPVAIPGENTTAHLLFTLAYPQAKQKIFLRYDEIESFVASGQGLGVIIHENRFTYQQKGLHKITDLGAYWEQHTGHPIPLGGIVIRRCLPDTVKKEVNELIRQSILQARKNYPQLSDYIRSHAQEMEEPVMRQHIDLYVNEFSVSLGAAGRSAILKLMETARSIHPALPPPPADLFAGQ